MVQELLGASHCERRNHDHAAARRGFAYDFPEQDFRVFRRMQAVAVSGFEHQVIRFCDRFGRSEQWVVHPSQVAGESQDVAVMAHADDGGAQDMARAQEFDAQVAG